jgi:hypothetical protein
MSVILGGGGQPHDASVRPGCRYVINRTLAKRGGAGTLSGRRHYRLQEQLTMSFRKSLVGAAIAATAALAGCTSGPAPQTPAQIDSLYGIPAGNGVPASSLRPDGSMSNGLMPAQPYDTGG